jgi:hypothetical protein
MPCAAWVSISFPIGVCWSCKWVCSTLSEILKISTLTSVWCFQTRFKKVLLFSNRTKQGVTELKTGILQIRGAWETIPFSHKSHWSHPSPQGEGSGVRACNTSSIPSDFILVMLMTHTLTVLEWVVVCKDTRFLHPSEGCGKLGQPGIQNYR